MPAPRSNRFGGATSKKCKTVLANFRQACTIVKQPNDFGLVARRIYRSSLPSPARHRSWKRRNHELGGRTVAKKKKSAKKKASTKKHAKKKKHGKKKKK